MTGACLAPAVAGGMHVWVSGDGPPVLLLHGLASSHRTWDLLEPYLEGFRLIRPDLPGHGASAAADRPYDFARMTSSLLSVLDVLEIGTASVVGHSWGAAVALDLAVTAPDRIDRLIMLDGGYMDFRALGLSREQTKERMDPASASLTEAAFLAGLERYYGAAWRPEFGPVMLAHLQSRGELVRPALAYGDHISIVDAMWEQDLTDLYRRLARPALMVLADEPGPAAVDWDRLRGEIVQRFQTLSPSLRVERLPGAIHDVHMQMPEAVGLAIRRFLTRG